MKLKELITHLQQIDKMNGSFNDDLEAVVVVRSEGAMGGTPVCKITNVNAGFDWDKGLLMFTTIESVMKVNSKIKQKVMNNTEIKKYLYRVKPTAKAVAKLDKVYLYHADIDQHYVAFRVPIDEMGENLFEDEIPAQLLIRWLV